MHTGNSYGRKINAYTTLSIDVYGYIKEIQPDFPHVLCGVIYLTFFAHSGRWKISFKTFEDIIPVNWEKECDLLQRASQLSQPQTALYKPGVRFTLHSRGTGDFKHLFPLLYRYSISDL
jgi:hypothetical protein